MMSRRIAVISEHASPLAGGGGIAASGQSIYVGQVARGLASYGYEVDIFTRKDEGNLRPVVSWGEGVRIVHVSAGPAVAVPPAKLLPYMPEFAAGVADFCRRYRYDLIHAHFFMSGLVACELKRQFHIPFIMTFHALGRINRLHEGSGDCFPDERCSMEDRIVAEADKIIATCPQELEDLLCFYRADAERIVVIPSGFDPSEYAPMPKQKARQALRLDPTAPVVLQVGSLVARQGLDYGINGFGRARYRLGERAQMLIAGGGSELIDPRGTAEMARLQAMASDAGVGRQVRFVGPKLREGLRTYYAAADVLVTTPWYDPHGMNALAAMACGTPVIGANVGAIKYAVQDGETGYLVAARSPDALSERLAFLYSQPALQKIMSRQAIQRAQERFTWAKVVNALAGIVEETLADRARQSAANDLAQVDRSFYSAVDTIGEVRQRIRQRLLKAIAVLAGALDDQRDVYIYGRDKVMVSRACTILASLNRTRGRQLRKFWRFIPMGHAADGEADFAAVSQQRQGEDDLNAVFILLDLRPNVFLVDRQELAVLAAAKDYGCRTIVISNAPYWREDEGSDVALLVPELQRKRLERSGVIVLEVIFAALVDGVSLALRNEYELNAARNQAGLGAEGTKDGHVQGAG